MEQNCLLQFWILKDTELGPSSQYLIKVEQFSFCLNGDFYSQLLTFEIKQDFNMQLVKN